MVEKFLAGNVDLLVPLGVLVLVMAAVMAWPPPAPLQTPRVASGHLLDGLRDYVARRG
jgi:hypothetical protein